MAEMYVQGVSTRKVKRVVEELCGLEVSSTQVSRAASELDALLEGWRSRPLGAYPYVVLDAQYEKVRQGGQLRDAAVLIAAGVDADGKRDVLGLALRARGALAGVLERAQEPRLARPRTDRQRRPRGPGSGPQSRVPECAPQRCQFHLQQNAGAYVPTQAQRGPVAGEMRAIFNALDRAEADRLLGLFVERHPEKAPKLAQWAEQAIPEGLTVFGFPESHRRRLRTSNGIERLHKEIKRRTRVATCSRTRRPACGW